MDIFKILGFFWEIVWIFFWILGGNFFGTFWEFFWEFFLRIFFEECFVRNFLGGIFWEDFFGRNILGGLFFGRNFLGGFFWRNSLFTLLKLFEYERDWIVCQYFGFCQDFVSQCRRKEGKFQSLEVREQAPSHLKIGKQDSFWLVKKFDFKIRETKWWAI